MYTWNKWMYLLFLLFFSHASSSTPIPLSDCPSLLAIPNHSNLSYLITQDIDCQGYTLHQPIHFSGTIEGQNFTISHLTIRSKQRYVGLFALLNQARIHHLQLSQFYIKSDRPMSRQQRSSQFIGILAGSSYLSDLKHIHVSHSHIDTSSDTSSATHQALLAPVIALLYASSAQHVSSVDNLIASRSNSVSLGGLFAEVYESPNLADLTVQHFKFAFNPARSESSATTVTLGGIAARVESAQIRRVTLEHTSFDAPHTQGQQGLLIGQVDSSLIQDVVITDSQLEHNEAQQGVIGFMSCHDAIGAPCALKKISIDHLNGLAWLQQREFIETKQLIELQS